MNRHARAGGLMLEPFLILGIHLCKVLHIGQENLDKNHPSSARRTAPIIKQVISTPSTKSYMSLIKPTTPNTQIQ
jgi:hypothetical protein